MYIFNEIAFKPNLQLKCRKKLWVYLSPILSEIVEDFEDKTIGTMRLKTARWNQLKKSGLFLGDQKTPGWGWKAREVFSLAEKYPFLNFLIIIREIDSHDLYVTEQDSDRGFFFNREKDFHEKIAARVRDFSIFYTPAFLRCVPSEKLGKISLKLDQFQVTMDEVLEKVI
jgi:hypothetical protein